MRYLPIMNKGFSSAQPACLLVALMFAGSALAQKNAISNSAVNLPLVKAVNLDGLMLTQSERSLLVNTRMRMQARAKNPDLFNAESSLSGLETPTLAPLLNANMAINGVVLRSNNRSIVWINGQPYSGVSDSTPVKTLTQQAGLPAAPPAVSSQTAKVGETIELPSGERQDLLPAGSIVILKPQTGSSYKANKE